MTLTEANDIIDRADRLFHRAAKALERGRAHDGTLERSERQADAIRARAEELLKPLGIVCDYPGVYPTFSVAGGICYTTEAAVSAALERKHEHSS